MADCFARLEAKANARKRIAPLERNVCKVPEEPKQFTQNQDDHVTLQIVEQAENRSFARLGHTINYLDDSLPDEQPNHKAYVDLTYANTCGPHSQGQQDIEYVPTHRIVDVTDPKWYPSLAKIFHQTEYIKDYWKGMHAGLVMSDYKLFLITIKHNKEHCTSNVHAHKQDVPNLVKDLRIVTRSSPIIFMLVRSHNIDKLMQGLIKRFHDLAHNDPTTEFYKSLNNPSLSNTGVKETSQLPKFTALPQMHFGTWKEFRHEVGIGALIEQRFQMGNQEYNAKAAVVPVPGSFNNDAKLYMAYHLQVSVRHDANKPRLMPGDHVTVDMNPTADTQAVNEEVWRGRVTEPTGATAMGMINVIVERPWKNGTVADKMEYNKLPMTRLKMMSNGDLLTWTQKNCKMNIVIYTKNVDKECKRLMENLARMTLSEGQRATYAEKARRLDAARQMLICTDHAQSTATALYEDIEAQHRRIAIDFITKMLHPHQQEEFGRWVETGVYDRTIWLTGLSGSGKTYLAMATMLPYLGNKQVVTKAKKKANKEKEDTAKPTDDASESATKGKTEKQQQDRYKEARDNMAPPQASRRTVTERGRITIAAMQNEAVDSQYVLMSAMAKAYCQQMGLPTPLVLRLHSTEAEVKAVAAISNPNYHPTAEVSRTAINPSAKITEDLLNSLLSDYLAAFRGGCPGIADRRFKHIEGSAARYILQLARFPAFKASQELLDAFSEEELEAWGEELKPLLDARSELSNTKGKPSKEIKDKIATAAKIVLNVLLERASVICTTVSVATQASFNMTRRTHVVALEEAGRANDAETVGLFSHYWHASLRIISGAVNQLRPAAFGDEKQNPFSKLLTVSTIARIQATGGVVSQLEASSRFHNEALFKLCAHVNAMPGMKPVQGAFNEELSEKYAEINKKIWGIKSNLIFLNTKNITTQRDANRSTYCRETAAVTIQDAINRMAYMDGKDHVIITPYHAQVMMLRRQRDYAVMVAHSTRKNALAKKLLDIEIVTIDSFMGKDRASVTVDTVGAVGHLFEFERTIVATTRARTSCQLVGPTMEYTAPNSKIKQSHPLTQAIRYMNKKKWIRLLEFSEIRGMEPYRTAMMAAGLGEECEVQVYVKASTIADVIYGEADHDPVDLEIIARMKEIKPNTTKA
ncbi:hypothetical protein COCC4DRAFT_203345 [Bipolaris maydis ATCC 48331]|nr:uncharacterized protein COCC4DRAFT_203345 [Bipolaris maydis ATCC 48331]ENI01832.1 hypothetical protein COCC4DRAFT_203345 [Bipolaris maydis ATCC 48331]KAJ5029278.1 hypothetical protein J3E73DRAFT_406387 [Bipolaris maydis]KAJ6276105.1 hypothetical protein PSV08DRAFT_214327 [Bipolaris maydis]KAJ6287249.1 hypothetical protein J3E71DRAFT_208600 [Bipolaris maydis]